VNWWVVLPLVLAMLALRLVRPNMLAWSLAWLAGMYLFFRYGFTPPVPLSVVKLYMGIVGLSLFAYVTSSRERRQATVEPLVRLVVEPRHRWALGLVLVGLPALAAVGVYHNVHVPLQAPSFARTIHPAPPDTITVHDRTINLVTADNPLRELETRDPEEFRRRLENGRQTYYKNCHYCHGDNMGGNGMVGHGLNPIPTNFTDPGTIAMLQESFLFWRISKGGPGLPDEGGPWDSAMPAWESFLTEDEIWEVVLFLYDFTGQRPRARGEEVHE
jgi:mono/diheme cytochrome c family protein